MVRAKLNIAFAILAFIVWTMLTVDKIDVKNIFLEGAAGVFVFLSFIFYSKFYSRQWAYYISLLLLGLFKTYTDGFGYFFYLVTTMIILGYYLKQEIDNTYN